MVGRIVCPRSAGQSNAAYIKMLRGSGMLRQYARRPRVRPRFDVDRPEVAVIDVLQRHRHDAGLAVDIDAAEELQAEARREIFALLRAASLLEHRRWSERVVELPRAPRPRMQRAGDEFPARLAIGKPHTTPILINATPIMPL